MKSSATTPQEYLDELPQDWRRQTLLQLRDLVRAEGRELEEVISYSMLGYQAESDVVMHLHAQKAHVALYVGNIDKVDPSGELVEGLSRGKGCVRFSKSKRVEDTRIHEFIRRTLELWRDGSDIGC